MAGKKSIVYKEIGEVLYYRNTRAKNIAIRINAEGHVRVTVPGHCSLQRAERFVIEKSGWISGKKEKIRRQIENNLTWKTGSIIEMITGRIHIDRGLGSGFEISNNGSVYRVSVPAGYDAGEPDHSKMLYNCVARIGALEAGIHLPEILRECSESYNLPFSGVTVRRMKTRWGSCSTTNRISLNSSLIFLPEQLIRYVCLHELMHVLHKNHSHRFWGAFTEIMPDAMVLRKKLRQQSIIA